MTLMKSLLLGSAAALVTVAAAQAADLPTKKGAPAAEYVRICHITVNGSPMVGWVLPGSDTCFKISGDITAQYTLGSTATQYLVTGANTLGAGVSTTYQNQWGMFDRGQVNFEAASNTAYGPLYSHIELQGNYGNGFDSVANSTVINSAFLTWAGLTAGKHGSFYDYLAGGPAWDDFISPDHSGGPIPLIAYTASFGGGFSATISAEQNSQVLFSDFAATTVATGTRAPDLVAAVDLKQGWGSAHVAVVAHNVREGAAAASTTTIDQWGWGVIGGLGFNLPSLGAGDDFKIQGVYTHEAIGYSGLTSYGSYNASNIQFGYGDAMIVGPATWSVPTTWSVAALADFVIGPTFKISPEASYGHVSWSNSPAQFSNSVSVFVGGGVLEWTPVKNLVFDLDLLYLDGTQSAPTGWAGVGASAWRSSFDGFNAKLRIERDF